MRARRRCRLTLGGAWGYLSRTYPRRQGAQFGARNGMSGRDLDEDSGAQKKSAFRPKPIMPHNATEAKAPIDRPRPGGNRRAARGSAMDTPWKEMSDGIEISGASA